MLPIYQGDNLIGIRIYNCIKKWELLSLNNLLLNTPEQNPTYICFAY